jgi:hypothetical protein
MEDEKMLFNVESDVAGYLGVLIDRHTDGTIIMRQSGLAKRIIEALHLDDSSSTSTDTPCTAFLPIDESGTPAIGLYKTMPPSLECFLTCKDIHELISL